jgi:hypothetical protein
VVLAVCVGLIPLPVFAGEPTPAAKPSSSEAAKPNESRTLRAAIEKIDARDLKPTMPSRPEARRAAQADTVKQSPAFFKTGAGIAVLAAIGAGVGYALYSTSHDRIHSPGRE